MQWETVWTFDTPQFGVYLSVAPEDMDPADSFEDEEGIEDIRNGNTEWFCAKMSVYFDGHEIAADHLGGCAYYNVSDFYTGVGRSGYFRDMVREAIGMAREEMARMQSVKLRQGA